MRVRSRTLDRLDVQERERAFGTEMVGNCVGVTQFCSKNGIKTDEIQSFTKKTKLARRNIPAKR